MRRNLVVLLLILFGAALPVLADGGEQGDTDLGLYLGWNFLDSYGEGMSALNPDDDKIWGARFGYFVSPVWSVELSTQHFDSKTCMEEVPVAAFANGGYYGGDMDFGIDSLRFNALYNFRPGQALRPFLTLGVGFEMTDAGDYLDDKDGSYNFGGGLRWLRGDTLGVRFDARLVSTSIGGYIGENQQNVETTVGLMWMFGGREPADSDGDGVIDRKDKCPDTPRGADVDEDGCPKDTDGDGVFDGIDKCPGTPKGVPVDADGCPKDSDGDGVHDGIDKCPDTPKGAIVDADGCPKDTDGDGVFDGLDKCPGTPKGAVVDKDGCPKDSDGDGVFDGIDKCPGTPKGAVVDKDGCPKDSDGDGVFDGIDKCPGTPAGAKVDERGCQVLFADDRNVLMLKGVNFELNSDKLTDDATKVLDRVVQSLNDWPEVNVIVAGHTDSTGNAGYNERLSQRRAESVMAYLAGHGVDAARMTAKGYGETKPIADNGTEEGRESNRRVELEKAD